MQRAQIDISLSKRPKVGSQNEISRNDKTINLNELPAAMDCSSSDLISGANICERNGMSIKEYF